MALEVPEQGYKVIPQASVKGYGFIYSLNHFQVIVQINLAHISIASLWSAIIILKVRSGIY